MPILVYRLFTLKVGSNVILLIQNYAHKDQRNKGSILYEEDSKLLDKAQAPFGLLIFPPFGGEEVKT